MRAQFTNRADSDIDALAEYIRKDSPRSALRFIRAVRRSANRLCDFPQSGERCWPEHPTQSDIRVISVTGFENHVLIFRPLEDTVLVIRVVHGSRDIENLFLDDS